MDVGENVDPVLRVVCWVMMIGWGMKEEDLRERLVECLKEGMSEEKDRVDGVVVREE